MKLSLFLRSGTPGSGVHRSSHTCTKPVGLSKVSELTILCAVVRGSRRSCSSQTTGHYFSAVYLLKFNLENWLFQPRVCPISVLNMCLIWKNNIETAHHPCFHTAAHKENPRHAAHLVQIFHRATGKGTESRRHANWCYCLSIWQPCQTHSLPNRHCCCSTCF